MRRWEIDPKLSAMENLFSAATFAAGLFKRSFKRKVLLTTDEWDEVMDDVVLCAVRQFLTRKLGPDGNYCREHSFYLNVHSCVLSIFQDRLDYYMNNVVKKKIQSLDRIMDATRKSFVGAPSNGFDIGPGELYQNEKLMNMPMPRYTADNDTRAKAQSNLRCWKNRSTHENFCKYEDEDDYWSYVEACEELGIPVDENAPLYRRGRYIK